MSKRRPLIYVLIIVVLGLLYFNSDLGRRNNTTTIPLPPQPIKLGQIFTDFTDLEDNELPVSPVLGGTFYTTALRIEPDFEGVEGNHFYAAIEDGHVGYILEYTLKEEYDRQLVYQVSKVTEGTAWPSSSGDTYLRTDEGFKKQ